MSAETSTQGRVTTEGPEGLHGDPGAVSGAAVAKPGIGGAPAWKWMAAVTGMHLAVTFGGDYAFGFPIGPRNVVFAVVVGLLTGIVIGPLARKAWNG